MDFIKNKKGFNVVEILIVIGVMVIVILMAGGLSGTFALRRTVDDVANRITSEMNITKLQAARDGVQYRTLINFDETNHKLKIKSVRGDSNRTSTFDNDNPITEQDVKLMNDYVIIPSAGDTVIDFNPNGTAESATSIIFRPIDTASKVKKCAKINITMFGQIRTLVGKWDGSDCIPIYDRQDQPS